ncbi:MAG TPA: sodium:proton antiporter [Coriobacteriia bacterium]|nr:sodium:proton antiporter [Coriobacteriia bacterium]
MGDSALPYPSIRELGLEELDLLVETRIEVLRCVFELPPDYDTSALAATNRAYYEQAIPEGSHIACAAFSGKEFVACAGMCFYRQMPSPESPDGNCGHLMNVYTRPAFRRQGIGRALVKWLLVRARDRGVDRVFLDTTPEGRSLYENLGFIGLEDYMEKRL